MPHLSNEQNTTVDTGFALNTDVLQYKQFTLSPV